MITNRIAVVGLDIGNCQTHIGLARGGKIDVLQNDSGSRKTPSIVGYGSDTRHVGSEAKAQMKSNYKNTVSQMMTLIGLPADDPDFKEISQQLFFQLGAAPEWLNMGTQQRLACKVKSSPKGDIIAESALASLLKYAKGIVEEKCKGQNVEDCVIAVPGFWSDRERRALMGALQLGGWKPLRLMNESCALALYYGLLRPLPEEKINVLFIDSGSSHTSASVVEFNSSSLRIVATAHDRTLGGTAFDKVIFDWLAADIKTRFRLDVSTNVKAQMKLLKEAQRIKKVLSSNRESKYNVEYLMNDTDVKGIVQRSVFEESSAAILERFSAPLQRVMSAAKLASSDLHSIEVVGGNTRVPMVKDKMAEILGKALSTTCDSDEGVVRGCTLECATLSSSFKVNKVFSAIDICSYPINLCWEEKGEKKKLLVFKAGDKLPCLKEIPFRRDSAFTLSLEYARDKMNQEGYSGIPLPSSVPDELGSFTIQGDFEGHLREYPQERTPRVKVRVSLDKNGLAFVREADLCLRYIKQEEKKEEEKKEGEEEKKEEKTEEKKKKPKAKIKVKAMEVVSRFTNGFTSEQLQRLQEHFNAMSAVDDNARLRDEANNALESYLLSTKSLINRGELDAYASDADREALLAALQGAEDWLYDYGWEADTKGLTDKLAEVEGLGASYFSLKTSYGQAKEALASFRHLLAGYSPVLDMKHITEEEKRVVEEERKAASTWCDEADGQLSADMTSAPAVSLDDIGTRRKATVDVIDPIKHKPVPTSSEKEKEAPKQEAEKGEEKAEEKEEEQKEILALM